MIILVKSSVKNCKGEDGGGREKQKKNRGRLVLISKWKENCYAVYPNVGMFRKDRKIKSIVVISSLFRQPIVVDYRSFVAQHFNLDFNTMQCISIQLRLSQLIQAHSDLRIKRKRDVKNCKVWWKSLFDSLRQVRRPVSCEAAMMLLALAGLCWN